MTAIDGPKLRNIRKQKGISAEEIASKAKINASGISRVENNKQIVSDRILNAYCTLLGFDIEELRQLCTPKPALFPLFNDVIQSVSGDLWARIAVRMRSRPAPTGDSSGRKPPPPILAADQTIPLARLMCSFIDGGVRSGRELTLVSQSPIVTQFHPELHEQFIASLVSVLKLVESLESFVIQERRPDSRRDPDVDA